MRMLSGSDILGAMAVAQKFKQDVTFARYMITKDHVMLVRNLRFDEPEEGARSVAVKSLKSAGIVREAMYDLESDGDELAIYRKGYDTIVRVPLSQIVEKVDGERVENVVEGQERVRVWFTHDSILTMLKCANKTEGVRFTVCRDYMTAETCDTHLKVMLSCKPEMYSSDMSVVLPVEHVLLMLSLSDRKPQDDYTVWAEIGDDCPASFHIDIKGRMWTFHIAARVESHE